jgi:hypothetical protein
MQKEDASGGNAFGLADALLLPVSSLLLLCASLQSQQKKKHSLSRVLCLCFSNCNHADQLVI